MKFRRLEVKERENLALNYIAEGVNTFTDRRMDNQIHVSNLLEFCPREWALVQTKGYLYNPGKTHSFGELVTFGIGHALHGYLQGMLTTHGSLKHEEVPLWYDVTPDITLTGSCDGLIHLEGEDCLTPIEIKSDGKESFDERTAPEVRHEAQLSMYCWMIEKMGVYRKVDPSGGLIIYISKLRRNMPVKIFWVDRNEDFINHKLKQLKEVKTFSKTKKLPNRMCNNRHSMMARRCTMVTTCMEDSDGNK